jgi:hypothetical protein
MSGIALGLCVILGIIFILMPNGWNIIPLFFMGVVVTLLVTRLRPLCARRGSASGVATDQPPLSGDVVEADGHPAPAMPTTVRRLNRAFGPIVAGMIIDLVDFATFGPFGLFLGLPIGGLAGYWMGKALGLSTTKARWCALAAGIYCTIPGTQFIPLAMLVGAYVRFTESGKKERSHRLGVEPE